VVLTTRDRPRLLPVALACYRQQTYPHRELIVVDDGDAHPVPVEGVAAVEGQLVRVPPGTPIGAKLNRGLAQARGELCHKMDDDDWYAPDFLERMVGAWLAHREKVCRPAIAHLQPFLVFDVAHWQLRRAPRALVAGATFLFAREDWEERPFRGVRRDDDAWFVADHHRLGRTMVPVAALESFLAVRHGQVEGNRGHTWSAQTDGRPLEDAVRNFDLHGRRPEDLLPDWLLQVYRELCADLVGRTAS
jgi:glycosyltransferase involved in cell wall biosynthesis